MNDVWTRLKDCFADWTADDTRLLVIAGIGFICLVALSLQFHAWLS